MDLVPKLISKRPERNKASRNILSTRLKIWTRNRPTSTPSAPRGATEETQRQRRGERGKRDDHSGRVQKRESPRSYIRSFSNPLKEELGHRKKGTSILFFLLRRPRTSEVSYRVVHTTIKCPEQQNPPRKRRHFASALTWDPVLGLRQNASWTSSSWTLTGPS